MVCRTRTDNSALITVAQREHGLDDGQVTGLFHSLQRESKQFIADLIAPTREEYAEFIDDKIRELQNVDNASMTQARRNSIERRLRKASDSEELPSAPMWYAQRNINNRAMNAKRAQDGFIAYVAERSGREHEELMASYHAYRESGLPEGVKRNSLPENDWRDFPVDVNSQWAAYALDMETGHAVPIGHMRCDDCGQFKGRDHSCNHIPIERVDFGDGRGETNARRHTNGGGMVATTAFVATRAHVAPKARVYGNAAVLDEAHIGGEAQVSGDAYVCNEARVAGEAHVTGNAWIENAAQVRGSAYVGQESCVSGNASVYGNARVTGKAVVTVNAKVYDNAAVYGHARVSGKAAVYDNAHVKDAVQVDGHARVFERGIVKGDAMVEDDSQVCGEAVVEDHVRLGGASRIGGNAHIFGRGILKDVNLETGHNNALPMQEQRRLGVQYLKSI